MEKTIKQKVKREKMRMVMPLLNKEDRKQIAQECGINQWKVSSVLSGRLWDDYGVYYEAMNRAIDKVAAQQKELARIKRWLQE
jgi:hypothetical protein